MLSGLERGCKHDGARIVETPAVGMEDVNDGERAAIHPRFNPSGIRAGDDEGADGRL